MVDPLVARDAFLSLRLVTPIVLAWIGWVVARAPFQPRANRILALFLFTLAAEFALSYLWLFFKVPGEFSPLRRAEVVVGYLDPPLMLAYALAFPRRRPALRSLPLWGGYGLAGSYLAYHRLAVEADANLAFDDAWLKAADLFYVNGTYLVGFWILLAGLALDERRFMIQQLRYLCVGFGFVTLSRSAAPFFDGLLPFPAAPNPLGEVLGGSLLAAALLAILYVVFRVLFPAGRGRLDGVLRALGLLLAVFFALGVSLSWFQTHPSSPFGFYAEFYHLRWIFFVMIVGYGVLQHQIFDLDLRVRQAALVLVSAAVGVALSAFAHLEAANRGLSRMESRYASQFVGLGVAALLYALARLAIRWMAPARAVPEEDKGRRLEMYEATLEYAIGRREWNEEERRFVETLGEVFGITAEEHEAIVARLRPPVG